MKSIWILMLFTLFASVDAASSQSLGGSDGGLLVIVPDRSVREIEADMDLVLSLETRAAQQERAAQQGRRASERSVERTKRELDDAKRRFDRTEKGDADKIAMEAEKKALEELKQYYERERNLRKAEEELAKAWLERSRAAQAALELERQLMESRAEFGSVTGTDQFRRNQVLFQLEEKTLRAQKDAYDRERRVADREKTVIESRLKLFEAREKIFDSRG